MFAKVKDQINNCIFEENKSAQKILSVLEGVTEVKIAAAESVNAELPARLGTVEASLTAACEDIRTLQKTVGVVKEEFSRVQVEKAALTQKLQEVKSAYSQRASQLVDGLLCKAELLRGQRIQFGDPNGRAP